MTVIRLSNGEVLLHSPCRPSNELVHDIAAIGTVTHVIAPNWFHDLYLAQYRKIYPNAVFWGCSRLRKFVDREIDGASPAPWSQELAHVTLRGLLTFDESLFFHRPSRTLIVADLLMNLAASAEDPPLTRIGLGLFRLDGSIKIFPVLRWFGFGAAKTSVRAAAQQVEAWQPQRLIVGHGTPVRITPTDVERALSW